MTKLPPIYNLSDFARLGGKARQRALTRRERQELARHAAECRWYPDCRNKCEAKFVARAVEKGWRVIRKGWPDFFLLRENDGGYEFMAVEVKRDFEEDGLSEEQTIVQNVLAHLGITCYVYSSKDGKLREPVGVPMLPNDSGISSRELAGKIRKYVQRSKTK